MVRSSGPLTEMKLVRTEGGRERGREGGREGGRVRKVVMVSTKEGREGRREGGREGRTFIGDDLGHEGLAAAGGAVEEHAAERGHAKLLEMRGGREGGREGGRREG